MDPLTRSKKRPKVGIELPEFDITNPIVRQRFENVYQTNRDINDGLTQADCKCFYQARFYLACWVNNGQVVWSCCGWEGARCYGGGTWDTNGWEFSHGHGTQGPGNSGWESRFTITLAKTCDDCECDAHSWTMKEYSNGVHAGDDGSDWGPLKKAPQWVRDLNDASQDDNFTDEEKKTIMKGMKDYMSNSAEDPWAKDPADKDCQEINGYCEGVDIP